MAKVRIKNVSPQGPLIVPALGGRIVEAGEVVEVPPEVAGKAGPGWRKLRANEDLTGFGSVRDRPAGGVDVLDLGSGLLAQAGVWEPVEDTTEKTEPAEKAEGGDR